MLILFPMGTATRQVCTSMAGSVTTAIAELSEWQPPRHAPARVGPCGRALMNNDALHRLEESLRWAYPLVWLRLLLSCLSGHSCHSRIMCECRQSSTR